MDFLLQLRFLNGTKNDFGGKDGHKLGQIFHYSQLMDLLNLDKIFKE